MNQIEIFFRCFRVMGTSSSREYVEKTYGKKLSDEYFGWLTDPANRSMVDAFSRLIVAFARDRMVRFDLHHENMMMRGDTIVIIDPIAPS